MLEDVKNFFKQYNKEHDVIVLDETSATVELASKALKIESDMIAKTLAFYSEDKKAILVVLSGDSKVSNGNFKREFGFKPKMIQSDDLIELTNHQMGGVCPFANPLDAKVYLDVSLKKHQYLYPACGSYNSAIKLSITELEKYSNYIKYVDVAKTNIE